MGALFGDAAPSRNDDPVGVADRGQAVGDHDGRAALDRVVERRLDVCLVLVVEMARRLVEDHDRRVLEQQPGDGQALLLAAAHPVAALADDVSYPSGSAGSCRGCEPPAGRVELRVRGIGLGIAEVGADRLVEQVRVLTDDTRSLPAATPG